jgi:hypothetical protein
MMGIPIKVNFGELNLQNDGKREQKTNDMTLQRLG